MVLLADMGNTNVTVAGWGDGGRVFELRLPTDHSWDGAAYTTALREGLAGAGQADALFEGAALCSVVPPLNEAVCAALQAVCGSTPVQLSRRGNTGGVDIFTDDPDEVGNDLLAGAIAATALVPMPAIVADLGTATTFTAQDKGGSILGVAIAPGVAMGLEALAGRASQLFSVAIQGPKAAIGTNTVASLQSGVVSIGASETALHGFLLPVLGAFHRAHPGIRLRIANHSTPQAFSALRNGLVDVAVVTSPTADTSGLHIEPLGQFEEVPVCGPSLMHLCGQKLTLAELSAYPFISLGRETASYAFAYNLFAENGAAFSPDIEVATSDQILPLVRLDLGVAFLPEAFAAPALQKGEIGRLTLAETIPPRQLLMARRSGQALSIAAKALEAMILG